MIYVCVCVCPVKRVIKIQSSTSCLGYCIIYVADNTCDRSDEKTMKTLMCLKYITIYYNHTETLMMEHTSSPETLVSGQTTTPSKNPKTFVQATAAKAFNCTSQPLLNRSHVDLSVCCERSVLIYL